jgi:integrase
MHLAGQADRATVDGLSDTSIVDDDADGVSNPKGHDAMKTFGPYQHRGRWRILIRQGSEQRVRSFGTETEAKAEIRRLRIEARKEAGLSVGRAIDVYAEQLRRNSLRERSIATTRYRLRKIFEPVLSVPLATVSSVRAKELYTKVEGSVDSRRNILNQARTFCRRAKENGWTDSLLLADVKGEGKRRCGKQKLTVDESRKFLAACLKLATSDNPKERTAGVGAAMPLVFGMRASEIAGLQVRDLDAGGTVIRITHAKSQAGIRSLQVPEWFRSYLGKLAEGKVSTDLLVGHDRTWLHREVRAICRQAGITEAPPHGLRGTHADLALMAAATPISVSKALGHESLATTYRHYADEGITQRQEHERAMECLSPPTGAAPN